MSSTRRWLRLLFPQWTNCLSSEWRTLADLEQRPSEQRLEQHQEVVAVDGNIRFESNPPENCHLTVKKLPKTWLFFLIAKNFYFFKKIAIGIPLMEQIQDFFQLRIQYILGRWYLILCLTGAQVFRRLVTSRCPSGHFPDLCVCTRDNSVSLHTGSTRWPEVRCLFVWE